MPRASWFLFIAGLTVFANPAQAGIVGGRNLGELLAKSHDVVACRLESSVEPGREFQIRVARSVKGRFEPGEAVAVMPPRELEQTLPPVTGLALMFVERTGSGYRAARLGSGLMSTGEDLVLPTGDTDGAALAMAAEGSAGERLLSEFLGVLMTRPPEWKFHSSGVTAYLIEQIRSGPADEVKWLKWLKERREPYAPVVALLWRLARSEPPAMVEAAALDLDALPRGLRDGLCLVVGMEFADHSAESLAALGRWIRERPGREAQWAAVRALRRIASPDSLPYLIEALDSPDEAIRAQAILTMHDIALPSRAMMLRFPPKPVWMHELPRPDPEAARLPRPYSEEWREDPQRVVEQWREWARRKSGLY